jgi:hypothetical protein
MSDTKTPTIPKEWKIEGDEITVAAVRWHDSGWIRKLDCIDADGNMSGDMLSSSSDTRHGGQDGDKTYSLRGDGVYQYGDIFTGGSKYAYDKGSRYAGFFRVEGQTVTPITRAQARKALPKEEVPPSLDGLPTLKGSAKQKTWAIELRKKMITVMEAKLTGESMVAFCAWVRAPERSDSRFWIDHRNNLAGAYTPKTVAAN